MKEERESLTEQLLILCPSIYILVKEEMEKLIEDKRKIIKIDIWPPFGSNWIEGRVLFLSFIIEEYYSKICFQNNTKRKK